MTGRQRDEQAKWTPAWVAVAAVLACVSLVLAERSHLLPFAAWGLAAVAVFGAVMTALVGMVRDVWLRTHVHRTTTWLAAGAWITWVSYAGWSGWAWLTLTAGPMLLAGLAPLCGTPTPERSGPAIVGHLEPGDRRPREVREWETLLRGLTKTAIGVKAVVPWERKADGERVHLTLPLGTTWRDLVGFCDQVAAARRLPQGCNVRVLEGDHQGEAVLDVMLRDCLADPVVVPEDYTPASINDVFAVMYAPRGEPLEMCLREESMVVGGAPGSGKTTLLHRLILWLARCVDALIWVMDPNGGGVAEPWIGPWARGEADAPIVDWVADDEASASVMVAVALAIAKDRKTSKIAVGRKRAARTMVLPVDKDLPAVVVIGDEGGELRQAANILAQLAVAGLSRIVQIGRAEAVRGVMSVLRGTADLLDKGMRVNAPNRICLRMEEEDEYTHILGAHPGSTRLTHKGSGYVRRATDPRPVFARSADFTRDAIERAAVALASLRPSLDERARLVASKVRVTDVLGGLDPWPELKRLPVMRDVEAGRAYEGRWDRYAHKLAEMRGEDVPDVEDEGEAQPVSPHEAQPDQGQPTTGGALAAFTTAVGLGPEPARPTPTSAAVRPLVDLEDPSAVEQAAQVLLAELEEPKLTARELILAILAEVHPEALTSDQIGTEMERRTGKAGNRTHRQDLLKEMVERRQIVRVAETGVGGRYAVKR